MERRGIRAQLNRPVDILARGVELLCLDLEKRECVKQSGLILPVVLERDQKT